MDQVNILLVSELPLLCFGMTAYLQKQPLVDQLHLAHSLSEASDKIRQQPIDVAVVELELLKPSGLGAIRALLRSSPRLRLIVLSAREIEPFVTQCMSSGALGYLSLHSPPRELLTAIHAVSKNEKYLSKEVASSYALAQLDREHHVLSLLSRREYQVFTGLAQGRSVNAIAAALCLSPKTIHVYRANVLHKLKATSSFELTLLALKSGVVTLDGIKSRRIESSSCHVDSER